LQKRNLLFLSLLIISVLLLTSCFLNPLTTEGLLKGQVLVPEGFLQTKDLIGEALPDATLKVIDLATNEVLATTTTDDTGHYQVFVPPGGPYLLEAVKEGVILKQITSQVEVGIEYGLGTMDCMTTAATLIAQAMIAEGENPVDIDCETIIADSNFSDVSSVVCAIIKSGEDPMTSALVQQAVENFLSPPTPTPPPPPTYTVTYDGNGNTGGTVPKDTNTYQLGNQVTILTKGDLEKMQDGISLLFIEWNTASDGTGTSYTVEDKFNMGSSNVTLYAQWSVLRGTGPAGGLVFYDKGSVSDGWRYLEVAPESTEWSGKRWGSYEAFISGTETDMGTGKSNTTIIVNWLDLNTDDSNGDVTEKTERAAYLCDTLDYGGYGDWFLPSRNEIYMIYINLYNISAPVGGFADDFYWSSSECYASSACTLDLEFSGSQTCTLKFLDYRVRAVRAFRSTAPTYIVNYRANGATGGSVPSDSYHYEETETVTVLDNNGSLTKINHLFAGWNTEADGNGTDYNPTDTFAMSTSNITLYAQWIVYPVHNITRDTYYAKIQAALDAALDGDIIEVSDGTYPQSLIFPSGKLITLQSVNGPNCTAITGTLHAQIILLTNSSDGTTLKGFTIDNESGDTDIRGIYMGSSYLTIDNCIISNNITTSFGCGIYNDENSILIIKNSTVSNNSNNTSGGGIYNAGNLIITGSTISGNTAQFGGGIYSTGTLSITGSTISGNTAVMNGGGLFIFVSIATIGGTNADDKGNFNLICGNTSEQISPNNYPNNYFFENCDVIGQTGPAGGLIFYDKDSVSDGWRYLEAAPNDQGISVWNGSGTVGGTSEAIGTGKANTDAIVAQSAGNADSAAKLCYELDLGGYTDWFLPSKNELSLMYTNLKVAGMDNFGDNPYWSSTEESELFAWYQYFGTGSIDNGNKNDLNYVRAIRKL